jgi:hypothetical protein
MPSDAHMHSKDPHRVRQNLFVSQRKQNNKGGKEAFWQEMVASYQGILVQWCTNLQSFCCCFKCKYQSPYHLFSLKSNYLSYIQWRRCSVRSHSNQAKSFADPLLLQCLLTDISGHQGWATWVPHQMKPTRGRVDIWQPASNPQVLVECPTYQYTITIHIV